MTWVRLDDGFPTHPRMVAAGLHGRALFVTGLCYCGQHNTDGRIPKGAVAMLAASAGVKASVAAKLVEIGSWIDQGTEYEVHDFLVYNPSRERIAADREASAERQRRFRGSQGKSRVTNGVSNGVTNGSPTRPAVPSEQNSGGLAPVECKNEACSNGWIDNPDDASTVIPCPDCERVPA